MRRSGLNTSKKSVPHETHYVPLSLRKMPRHRFNFSQVGSRTTFANCLPTFRKSIACQLFASSHPGAFRKLPVRYFCQQVRYFSQVVSNPPRNISQVISPQLFAVAICSPQIIANCIPAILRKLPLPSNFSQVSAPSHFFANRRVSLGSIVALFDVDRVRKWRHDHMPGALATQATASSQCSYTGILK